MGRTILDLITADAAGEQLSTDEVQQIENHHWDFLGAWAELSALLQRYGPFEMPTQFTQDLHRRILQLAGVMEHPSDLRELIRVLADVAKFADSYTSELSGVKLRRARERRRGAAVAAQQKRNKGIDLLREVQNIQAKDPDLSDTAAARKYLHRDDDFAKQPRQEQARQVASLTHRIHRAKKKADTR